MLMCYAFQYGTVGVVSHVIATYPLFTIAFSAILLKREKFTWKTIAGAMLTVVGVAIISSK
jgi:drug/metabolite transporter (DMT)-like permease